MLQPEPPNDFTGHLRAEIDTRADTICAGKAFASLYYSRRVVDVGGFHSDLGTMKGVPIARVATAYDCPTGETLILAANEALYFGNQMEHSLFSPQQICDNGLRCDPLPRQYSPSSIHAIYDPGTDTTIPFQLHGCISYVPIRLPTETELQTCWYIELTSEAEWQPYDTRFASQEVPYNPAFSSCQHPVDNRYMSASSSMDRRSSVDAPTLSQRWDTSLSSAMSTLRVTTQRGIHYFQGPSFSRRFRTHQTQLSYPHLHNVVYTNTLLSDEKSVRGNVCAQIFVTDKSHAQIYPLTTKSDAYNALDLYCSTVGIPKFIVTDNAGDETGNQWNRVWKKYLFQQQLTEPHSPWQNKAEREIQELKKHFRRIMHRSRCPEVFWDYGLQFTAQIRERMSWPTCDGRTPLEILTGETPDISVHLDFDFYSWVKFHDRHNGQGLENEVGRWLGVALNAGQAMTYYVLKSTGKVLTRSTVWPLTKDEWLDDQDKQLRIEFNTKIEQIYGALMTISFSTLTMTTWLSHYSLHQPLLLLAHHLPTMILFMDLMNSRMLNFVSLMAIDKKLPKYLAANVT